MLHWCNRLSRCSLRTQSASEAYSVHRRRICAQSGLWCRARSFVWRVFAQLLFVTVASAFSLRVQTASKVVLRHVCIATARKQLKAIVSWLKPWRCAQVSSATSQHVCSRHNDAAAPRQSAHAKRWKATASAHNSKNHSTGSASSPYSAQPT